MKRLITSLSVLFLFAVARADGFGPSDKVLYFNSETLINVIKNTFPQNLQLDVANKYVELMDSKGNVSIDDLITVCGVGKLDNAKCKNFIRDLINTMGDDTIKPFYWADYVSKSPEPIRLAVYSSGDGDHKNSGLDKGEWAMTFGWMQESNFMRQYPQTKYIRGISACTNESGTKNIADTSKNFTLNEQSGEQCWCKMTGPEESAWVYTKGDGRAGGCARSCALECVSALRTEPMRGAMFTAVKLNGSNANTNDEKVIGDALITAVTPPPPPKPKPEPEPQYEPQPDPCWKYENEDPDEYCAVNFDGYYYTNNPNKCSGLSPGEWKSAFTARFSHGCGAIVTGSAKCATNDGKEWLKKGTPRGDGGKYCWCRGETESTPYNFTPVWVFLQDLPDSAACAHQCVGYCKSSFAVHHETRSALFGLKY